MVSASLQPYGLYSPWNSPGQNTGVGSLSLLQGLFPTQVSNPGIEPRYPSLQVGSLPSEPQGKPIYYITDGEQRDLRMSFYLFLPLGYIVYLID